LKTRCKHFENTLQTLCKHFENTLQTLCKHFEMFLFFSQIDCCSSSQETAKGRANPEDDLHQRTRMVVWWSYQLGQLGDGMGQINPGHPLHN
jgi:hypothetical protein